MIWVILTVVSVAVWGLADMLSKKGTEAEDPFSHVRFVICTGAAMLVFMPFFRAFSESKASFPQLLAQYPVFLLITLAYVISLLLSFFSFRHLEASAASPLCNTSAAMILLMLLAFYLFSGRKQDMRELLTPLNVLASLLVCGGVIAVGIVRSAEEEQLRERRELAQTVKRYGAAAILFPLLSAFFDALESVGDSLMVDAEAGAGIGSIDYMRLWAATYLLICIPLWIYLLIKEKKVYQPFSKKEGLKLASGLAEVSAYTLYILALEQEPFFVSFLSSTYCVFSILFCRIFLKEKLSKGQYLCIAVIIAGLALFGIAEGLAA